MHMLIRATAVSAVAAAATLATAGAASASPTASWTCRGSAVEFQLATNSRVVPLVTERTPCADGSVGVPNLAEATGLAPLAGAQTAYGLTSANPAQAAPQGQAVGAQAGVEALHLRLLDGGLTIGVDAARAAASGSCQAGSPALAGTSTVTRLRVNGREVTLDGLLQSLVDPITNTPLGAVVQVKFNEQTKDANGLTQRAVHIVVLPALGAAPLADVVIAEAGISSASACDPNADGNGPGAGGGTGTGTGRGSGSGSTSAQVCPTGSTLDTGRGVCVITAAESGGQGTIVVGVPYSGPSGGRVVSLANARKRYSSPCLRGRGPKFATIGTNGRDRITGTNRPDRILGLGGADAIDGGRGNDCVDGGRGSDNLAGGIGDDRVYGFSQADHLNGGPGTDRLSGGSGADSINTGFGRDRVLGGTGADVINAATAGKPARIDCGPGRDKVRLNRNEKRRAAHCEVRYVLRDR